MLDSSGINDFEIQNRIKKCDIVIDITRPYYRNILDFHNDELEDIYDNNCLFIDGNKYAKKHFKKAKSKFIKWVSEKPNQKI